MKNIITRCLSFFRRKEKKVETTIPASPRKERAVRPPTPPRFIENVNSRHARLIMTMQLHMQSEDKRGGKGMRRSEWVQFYNKRARAQLKKDGFYFQRDGRIFVNRRRFDRDFGVIVKRAAELRRRKEAAA